jgi:hypothetical protein
MPCDDSINVAKPMAIKKTNRPRVMAYIENNLLISLFRKPFIDCKNKHYLGQYGT